MECLFGTFKFHGSNAILKMNKIKYKMFFEKISKILKRRGKDFEGMKRLWNVAEAGPELVV